MPVHSMVGLVRPQLRYSCRIETFRLTVNLWKVIGSDNIAHIDCTASRDKPSGKTGQQLFVFRFIQDQKWHPKAPT